MPRTFPLLALLPGLLFSLPGLAQDATATAEFQQRTQALGERLNRDSSRTPRCRELQRRVTESLGQPQRHYVAQQAYNAECRTSFADSDEPGNRPGETGGGFLND